MRDQGPHGPGSPSQPGDGPERPPAPVTRGRFGMAPRDSGGGPTANGRSVPRPTGGPILPPLDDTDVDADGPVDLVELQADDELINALSSGLGVSGPGTRGYDVDDRLVALLSSWKEDVDRDPVPELVDTDQAVEMLQPARPARRSAFLRPLVAAAAVAACALTVISVGAYEAQPGDALWGVSRVLYSERADQVQAAADLRTGIERVNAKLAAGDTTGARQDLAALGALIDRAGPDRRSEFEQQNRFLNQKVAETPPGIPTDPRSPLRDGTPPPPPPSTEGGQDERPARPESGTSTPGGTSTGGSSSSSGTSTGGSSGSGTAPAPEGSTDPRVLSGPGNGSGGPTTTSPSSPPETSPTTEGSADPSTTSTTPTAAGEGSPQDPPSSSASGAVSSTPS